MMRPRGNPPFRAGPSFGAALPRLRGRHARHHALPWEASSRT
nr:MAG TPA: hypothetical protein [Caudoviricetes sp.]